MRISDWSSDVCSSDLLVETIDSDPRSALRPAVGLDQRQAAWRRQLERQPVGLGGRVQAGGAMKHEDAIRILTTWQERMQDCEQRMGELGALIGTSPEAPLQASVYGLMGDYTKAISTRLGCSDEWLEAWWLEHNFGEWPMSAGDRKR